MALPGSNFPTRVVHLSGGDVAVRGLSYAEGQQVKGEDAVATMVALATGYTLDDVKVWMANALAGDIRRVTDAISQLSGLDDDAQFPG